MKYSPEKHRRQTIRLKDYDYSLPGAYFVSICTQDRLCLFGNVVNDLMVLNKAGKMIEHAFLDLSQRFDEIEIKAHVVMPNHCHVIIINEYDCRRGESCIRPCIRPGLVRREETGEHKVRIYEYIRDNPKRWATDGDNPANITANKSLLGTSPCAPP